MPPNVPPIFGNTLVRLPTRLQRSNGTGGNIRLLDAIVASRTALDGRTSTHLRRMLVLDGKTGHRIVSLSSATIHLFEKQTQDNK